MRKMDEMEMKISLESLRWAWLFTVVALFAWGISSFVRTGAVTLPLYLLIAQNAVYFASMQILKWRMGDEGGKSALLCFAAVAVCLAVFGFLLFFTRG